MLFQNQDTQSFNRCRAPPSGAAGSIALRDAKPGIGAFLFGFEELIVHSGLCHEGHEQLVVAGIDFCSCHFFLNGVA